MESNVREVRTLLLKMGIQAGNSIRNRNFSIANIEFGTISRVLVGMKIVL